jgi:hypothetical protein
MSPHFVCVCGGSFFNSLGLRKAIVPSGNLTATTGIGFSPGSCSVWDF